MLVSVHIITGVLSLVRFSSSGIFLGQLVYSVLHNSSLKRFYAKHKPEHICHSFARVFTQIFKSHNMERNVLEFFKLANHGIVVKLEIIDCYVDPFTPFFRELVKWFSRCKGMRSMSIKV